VADLFTAFALVLVIEGLLLAVMADRIEGLAERLREVPPPVRRIVGLAVALLGLLGVWLIRG
jgi:hypothetical protein